MKQEKNKIMWVISATLLSVLLFFAWHQLENSQKSGKDFVKAGFLFDGDESTPYSENFIRAMNEVEMQYGDRVETVLMNNVPFDETEKVLKELINSGCDIIFTNSFEYGEPAKKMAAKYPDIQFCEATCNNANEEPVLDNYHTFMGEIYQGRYVAGLLAGLKLKELIDAGKLEPDQAYIGYIGAYPYAEVVSGYTAFFLGTRKYCPTVRMKVKYANTWTSYMLEKKLAKELIDEGCTIISQHSDTIGPAVICEETEAGHPVFHVGYNQDMMDVAPTTSLTGTRIDWAPYICGAVGAVLSEKKIEDVVNGNIHGNDISAGFEKGWVKMLELNPAIAPKGSRELLQNAIEDMIKGKSHVFLGDYIGVNPEDESDTWDLNQEYIENEDASAPSFHYILKDVIEIE